MADPGGARAAQKKNKDFVNLPSRRPRGWSSFTQLRHGDEPADPYPPLVRPATSGTKQHTELSSKQNSVLVGPGRLGFKVRFHDVGKAEGPGKVHSRAVDAAATHNANDYAAVARKGGTISLQNENKGSGGKASVGTERNCLELHVADTAASSVETSKLGSCAEIDDSIGMQPDHVKEKDTNDIALSVPPEPEWEEDDIYLKLRKDALRVSRSMSRHARAAANAYNRGDHYRAKQLSKEAREEQALVSKLNAEAAAEILKLRNEDAHGDIWTIDLHGLHTGEAIAVLQKKLSEFEAYIASSSRYSEEPLQFKQLGDSIVSQGSSTDIASYHEGRSGVSTISGLGTLHQPPSSSMQRELRVITGLGVHSRNGASLPNAARAFLINNSYRFSEPRPGILAVQLKLKPKFSLKEKV